MFLTPFLEIMKEEEDIRDHQEANRHIEREIKVIVLTKDLQRGPQEEETIVVTKKGLPQ